VNRIKDWRFGGDVFSETGTMARPKLIFAARGLDYQRAWVRIGFLDYLTAETA
jgi:hypothetical protein